ERDRCHAEQHERDRLRHPGEPPVPQPRLSHPRRDEADRGEDRREELGDPPSVGEHRPRAARPPPQLAVFGLRRADATANAATASPIAPSAIPMNPIVFAVDASSEAAEASLEAAVTELFSRVTSRSILSESSVGLGCFTG